MPNFTLEEFKDSYTRQRIHKLIREGSCFYDEFKTEIKKDNNLSGELSDLWATLKYVANGKTPFLRENKYRKIRRASKYPIFEVKSKNLRLYVFTDDEGMIIILGGKKKSQVEDI